MVLLSSTYKFGVILVAASKDRRCILYRLGI